MKYLLTFVLFSLLFFLNPTHAQNCNPLQPQSTPDSRFTDHRNGTVTDNVTNLMWSKCSLGQTYNATSNGCDLSAMPYTLEESFTQVVTENTNNFAGFSDWRIPNVKELSSLVEYQCYNPAINTTIFPGMYIDFPTPYWTSSHNKFDPSCNYWVINFIFGLASSGPPSTPPPPAPAPGGGGGGMGGGGMGGGGGIGGDGGGDGGVIANIPPVYCIDGLSAPEFYVRIVRGIP